MPLILPWLSRDELHLRRARSGRYPIFAYGGLRSGGEAHGSYRRRYSFSKSPAFTVRGLKLFARRGRYPVAVESLDGMLKGELLRPAAEHYQEWLTSCDVLEEYYGPRSKANATERLLVLVQEPGSRRREWAWIYLASAQSKEGLLAESVAIPAGDWLSYLRPPATLPLWLPSNR